MRIFKVFDKGLLLEYVVIIVQDDLRGETSNTKFIGTEVSRLE